MQPDPSFDRRCLDALQRARAEAFAKQIPILYVILSVNVATLMATHWDRTPTFLGLVVPGLLVGAAVGRMIVWLLRARGVVDRKSTRLNSSH